MIPHCENGTLFRLRLHRKSLTSASLAIVAGRIKLAAFGTTNPERGGITGLPIVPLSVERLKPPPLPGPVGSHRRVAVVDFRNQLRTGSQPRSSATFVRTSRSTPETKRYPPGLTSRAIFRRHFFGIGWGHVAEKVTRHHHILRPKNTYEFRVSGIPKAAT